MARRFPRFGWQMLTGFNTDFKYKGTVYHVQTEDNGTANPVIVTLLYQGGAILASKKTSYADILKSDRLESVIRELMESQHKQIIRELISGKFGDIGGPKAEEAAVGEAAVPGEEPVDLDAIENKSLDEVILDYLSTEEE